MPILASVWDADEDIVGLDEVLGRDRLYSILQSFLEPKLVDRTLPKTGIIRLFLSTILENICPFSRLQTRLDGCSNYCNIW